MIHFCHHSFVNVSVEKKEFIYKNLFSTRDSAERSDHKCPKETSGEFWLFYAALSLVLKLISCFFYTLNFQNIMIDNFKKLEVTKPKLDGS